MPSGMKQEQKGLVSRLDFMYGPAAGLARTDVVDINDAEDFPMLGGGPPELSLIHI